MANFLDLIKGEGLAVQFIKSVINTDRSASSILQELSDNGIGIRRQTGLQVINYLRNTALPASNYIDNLTLNSLPSIQRLAKSTTKQLRNFAYKVQLTGFDKFSNQLTKRNVTVSTNQLLTKQQALDIATALGESESQSGGITGSSGQVIEVTQNSDGLVF